jgi:BCD family chlorophyll transporter-like MFS transporter
MSSAYQLSSSLGSKVRSKLSNFAQRYVPFADAASIELPLPRLLRLCLFQTAIGMTMALLVGTLNRVMIVELGVPAWWVALSVAIPLIFAPLRALIGYRSDTHPSALGLRRLPYLWIGNIFMFGGLAIMPFALLLLNDETIQTVWMGRVGACLAFLLVGAGMQTTQTAGLALATDIAPAEKRPRVVALLHSAMLVGLIIGSGLLGWLLKDFSPTKLVQVVQGSAVLVAALNLASLWKQEARQTKRGEREPDGFSKNWRQIIELPNMRRFLWTVGIGSCAFSMQDIILEPYGGEVLHLDVSFTSSLTALSGAGALVAFAIAARLMGKGLDACRVSAMGLLMGLPGFACVMLASPMESALLFRVGTTFIGFGSGMFSVGMLIIAMEMPEKGLTGMVLGAWGAVQATASGLSMAIGGVLKDSFASFASKGYLGEALIDKSSGYGMVFAIEMFLLFVALVAMAPLSRKSVTAFPNTTRFGLAELPN